MPVYGEWPEAKYRLRQMGHCRYTQRVYLSDFGEVLRALL